MGISSLYALQFRNLAEQTVNIKEKYVYLIGQNGQGKTNFLEAVYFSCFGSSFRERKNSKIVTFSANGMFLESRINTADGLEYQVSIKFDGKKQILIDGNKIKDRKELIYLSPCIIFSHDDIQYIRGSLQQKRHFINQILGLYDPLYLDALRSYQKVILSKNKILKEKQYSLLAVLNKQQAEYGMELQKKRKASITEFNDTLSVLFTDISGITGKLFLEYRPSWKYCTTIEQATDMLTDTSVTDKKYCTSSSGPHRDRIIIRLDELDFSSFASTGQTRLIALLLKVAQARFFTAKTGKLPILLLDDVFLEMDEQRKERFLTVFPDNSQAFFTFLPGEKLISFPEIQAQKITVANGVLQ